MKSPASTGLFHLRKDFMNYSSKIQEEKEKLTSLHGIEKLQYIWDYYKLPLLILFIFLYIISYTLYGHFTHKDTMLYAAFVNVAPSEQLAAKLSTDFLDWLEEDTSQKEFYLYEGLYLAEQESSSHTQYIYASRMKILASIDSEQLDVVFMNREAFDAFSQNGYLCNLEEVFSTKNYELYEIIKPDLVKNIVIIEDNLEEVQLDSSVTYEAVTDEYPLGLNLSHTKLMENAGFEDTVYLGIVANSPRIDTAVKYITYLFENKSYNTD